MRVQPRNIPWSNVDFNTGFWSVHECLIDFAKQRGLLETTQGVSVDADNISNFLQRHVVGWQNVAVLKDHVRKERKKYTLDLVGWENLVRIAEIRLYEGNVLRLHKRRGVK